MIDAILNNFVEITCGAVLAALIAFFRMLKGLISAVMAISHDTLYRHGEFYVLTNEITVEEMKNMEYIYRGYHALGGNGTGTELYEKCKELPVVDRRTKWNPYYTERMKKNED